MGRPLEGKRILVTRAAEQVEFFSQEIAAKGGIPIEIPVIAFREPKEQVEVDKAINRITEFSKIIFTSANGVHFFFEALKKNGVCFPDQLSVAVIGNKTERVLKQYQVNPDLIPDQFVAESLIERLKPEVTQGEEVLLARGNLARKKLPAELSKLGVSVTDLTVYETIVNEGKRLQLLETLKGVPINVVTFTSSSTVRYFFELIKGIDLQDRLREVYWACIGPITAKTLSKHGYDANIVPEEYTTTAMLGKIEQFYKEAIS